jgi:hypothetical protein
MTATGIPFEVAGTFPEKVPATFSTPKIPKPIARQTDVTKNGRGISSMVTERVLWVGRSGQRTITCGIASSCAGVELSVVDGDRVLRREQYPDRSTAYERARDLNHEFAQQGYLTGESDM